MLDLPPPNISHLFEFLIFQQELLLQKVNFFLVFVIIDNFKLLCDFKVLDYFCSVPDLIIDPVNIDKGV